MEPSEWLVFDDQTSYSNGLADGLFRNPAVPLAHNLLPSQTAIELFEHNPHHDTSALEGRLAPANL